MTFSGFESMRLVCRLITYLILSSVQSQGFTEYCFLFNHYSIFYQQFSREIYHTKRMQRITDVVWSSDDKYVINASDEMNLRIWKARASEKLGIVSYGFLFGYDSNVYEQAFSFFLNSHHPRFCRYVLGKRGLWTTAKLSSTSTNCSPRSEASTDTDMCQDTSTRPRWRWSTLTRRKSESKTLP